MKELFELHAKVLACQTTPPEFHPVSFSREEIEDDQSLLPAELIDEIHALQEQINPCLPDDVDYLAFVGGAEPPLFDLVVDNFALDLPNDFPLVADRPLIPQLQVVDWDAVRLEAEDQQDRMQTFRQVMEATMYAPRSTKAVQRDFKEDAKDFIREKRTDASKIHVLWFSDDDRLLAEEFPTADELRERLPRILFGSGEVVTIVAYGKPLPVEKIDALMSEAHRKTALMLRDVFAKAGESAFAAEKVLEVESTVSEEAEPVPD